MRKIGKNIATGLMVTALFAASATMELLDTHRF